MGGVYSLGQLDIDAFPDTTPVQVQINTTAPALGPEEVERQITFPIEQAISGLPGLEQLRSISKFGLSQVVVLFDDGIDIYFARQLINERLATVELPPEVARPKMGPVATGLGEVFHYVVTGQGTDPTDLRTIHDWVIKPAMRTVPGTAEINSWGGYEKQYQVRIDPERLIKHGLTFDEVIEAVKKNNLNVGGGNISRPAACCWCKASGRTINLDEIRNIVVAATDGVPIRVSDVADVADRPRNPPRRRHRRRQGRSRARPGLHADGRKQPRSHLGPAQEARGGGRHAAAQRRSDARLRPHRAGQPRHRHGSQEPASKAACWSSPCCSPSWATLRAALDRGPGHSAVDAVRL